MSLRNLQDAGNHTQPSLWKSLVAWLVAFHPAQQSAETSYYNCQNGPHEISLTVPSIVSLGQPTASLCTVSRITDTGRLPVAQTYDGHDWERAGGTFAATISEITCDEFVCQVALPSGDYELVQWPTNDQRLTGKESIARFLERASSGARPRDLEFNTFDPISYIYTQMYDTEPTYHREFYRRHANPHWRFHKREFAANLDPCGTERNTTWRANVISSKDYFGTLYVRRWENRSLWEISIDDHVRTVVPRLRLEEDESQLEGPYDLCASASDIRRGVYRVQVRGKCRKILAEDLYLFFPDEYPVVNALAGILPSLSDDTAWQESSVHLPHYILKTRVPMAHCTSLLPFHAWGPPVFAKTASGEWMQFDPRIVMEENTPDAPLLDGGATSWWNNHTSECANVKRHILNEANCVMTDQVSCVAGSRDKDQMQAGLVVCGSPGEVANDPTLGDSWLDIPSITTPGLSRWLKVPRDTTGAELLSKQKGFVWSTIAVTSNDQLRQRVAWALLQIFALPGEAISSYRLNTEIFLNYYDVFVRHAFGNYRDILREMSWNPVMAESLSYVGSRSLGYVFGRTKKEAYPDENYARELMQLFTIGVSLLNMDGTPVLDADNNTIPSYTNEDIVSSARVWTGFQRQSYRANIEGHDRGVNRLDPLKINPEFHDRYPKTDLFGGYLGDRYPLCVNLPNHMHIRKGAKYRLLGRSPVPEQYEGDYEWSNNDGVKRLVLEEDGDSGLFSLLCASKGGQCSYPSLVILDSDLTCNDPSAPECEVDTVRVVQVGDVYYEYVKNVPCVELAFFENGIKASALNNRQNTVCVNPNLVAASEACCPKDVKPFKMEAVPACRYSGERMRFSTAIERCEAMDRELCDYKRFIENESCPHIGFHWTSSSCKILAKVNAEGDVALVHDLDQSVVQVRPNNLNYFGVYWDGDAFPSVDNNCGDGSCELSGDACICEVAVEESVVFQTAPKDKETISRALRIGALKPSSLDGYTSTRQADYTYYSKAKDGSCCDESTIFEISDDNGRTHVLLNVESKVSIQTNTTALWSFRNAPHFNSVTPTEFSEIDAVFETEALIDHLFYHPNTPPFVAYRLIQRFGVSNPSPRYTKEVATTFKTGTYQVNGVSFGEGRYGDLAATIAAVLFDREAQSVVADPARGALREPMLKVLGFLRAMGFEALAPLIDLDMMEEKIGQAVYMQPTVFSFFRPEYQAPGKAASAGLVSPEAEPMSAGKVIGILNGLFDLVDDGLERCENGFGLYGFCGGYSSGTLTYKPRDPTNRTESLQDMATLLTAGRIGPSKLSLVESVIANEPNDETALQTGLKLLLTTPEFHATSQATVAPADEKEYSGMPEATQSGGEYKAVIHLTLQGGLDSFNLLVPHPTNCTKLNQEYKSIRDTLALGPKGLLDIEGGTEGQPCSKFGLHHYFPVAKELYDDGDLLFLANTGVLTEYVDKSNFAARTATPLFGHNTMQDEIDALDPRNLERGTGTLGRLTDALIEAGYRSGRTAVETTPRNLAGRLEAVSPIYSLDGGGIVPLDGNITSPEMRQVMNALNDDANGVYGEVWSSILRRSLNQTEKVYYLLKRQKETVTPYEAETNLARRFKLISQLIAARSERQVDRDVFTVRFEGFDMHGEVTETLKDRLGILNEALRQFIDELKAQGVWDNVVIIETSDFGRTLTPNSGGGSDHGWGGNYFMTGGSLTGRRILGQYPDRLTGALNIGRGRLIPTMPWESPFHAIAEWMGITDADDLDYVLPNRKSFPDLMHSNEIFE